jgi:hypothetical protein
MEGRHWGYEGEFFSDEENGDVNFFLVDLLLFASIAAYPYSRFVCCFFCYVWSLLYLPHLKLLCCLMLLIHLKLLLRLLAALRVFVLHVPYLIFSKYLFGEAIIFVDDYDCDGDG